MYRTKMYRKKKKEKSRRLEEPKEKGEGRKERVVETP